MSLLLALINVNPRIPDVYNTSIDKNNEFGGGSQQMFNNNNGRERVISMDNEFILLFIKSFLNTQN